MAYEHCSCGKEHEQPTIAQSLDEYYACECGSLLSCVISKEEMTLNIFRRLDAIEAKLNIINEDGYVTE